MEHLPTPNVGDLRIVVRREDGTFVKHWWNWQLQEFRHGEFDYEPPAWFAVVDAGWTRVEGHKRTKDAAIDAARRAAYKVCVQRSEREEKSKEEQELVHIESYTFKPYYDE